MVVRIFIFLVLFLLLLILLLFIFLLSTALDCGVSFNIACVKDFFGVSAPVAPDLQSNAKQAGSTADTAKLTSIVTRKKRLKQRVKSPIMHQVPLKAYTNLNIAVPFAITADWLCFDV